MSVPLLFDRQRVQLHRDRSTSYYHELQDVYRQCSDRLLDRLEDIKRPFQHALEIGGRGSLASALQSKGIETVSADLSYRMVALNASHAHSMVCMDEEFLPFRAHSFDLVIASFNLHWVNDLPGTLVQIREILRPDGLFLAAIPILPTLSALRKSMTETELEIYQSLSPRISPFPDLRACAELMQRAGFALPVIDKEYMAFTYQSSLTLMRDLRWAGETNALYEHRDHFDRKAFFAGILSCLDKERDLTIPLHFAVMTGWAPDKSQPQPLKPGQFDISLEDALSGKVQDPDKDVS